MPAWLVPYWYELVRLATTFGMMIGFSLRVRGRHHLPPTGPVLLIANHQSFFDPVLVGLAARRQPSYLARKSLFRNPFFAVLIRSLNAVPVDQDGVGKEGLKAILKQLQAGRVVVVFPEGERTADGALQRLKPGIMLLIKRTQAPIVPVGIAGAAKAWPRSQALPVPAPLFLPASERTLAVSVGRPLDAKQYTDMQRESALEELLKVLQLQQASAERLRRK